MGSPISVEGRGHLLLLHQRVEQLLDCVRSEIRARLVSVVSGLLFAVLVEPVVHVLLKGLLLRQSLHDRLGLLLGFRSPLLLASFETGVLLPLLLPEPIIFLSSFTLLLSEP